MTALAVAGIFYSCVACHALRHEILTTPRDPETGVVIGAEAIDLDPLPSPGAGTPRDVPTSACLLLHGWVGSRKDFNDLGERLAAAGYHVRLARLPGHGTTPTDFAAQTPESMLAGVEVEYRALRERYAEVNIIGFSMGGTLATLLAAREDVDRLVLVAPYYRVTYEWYYILPPEIWNGLLGWALPYVIKPEGTVRVNRVEAREDLYYYRVIPTNCVRILTRLGNEARRPETLSAVLCPVLLVMSEGDEAASPTAARKALACMGFPDKTIRMFSARSNHHLLSDYDREEAKEAILEFLATSRYPKVFGDADGGFRGPMHEEPGAAPSLEVPTMESRRPPVPQLAARTALIVRVVRRDGDFLDKDGTQPLDRAQRGPVVGVACDRHALIDRAHEWRQGEAGLQRIAMAAMRRRDLESNVARVKPHVLRIAHAKIDVAGVRAISQPDPEMVGGSKSLHWIAGNPVDEFQGDVTMRQCLRRFGKRFIVKRIHHVAFLACLPRAWLEAA